MPAAPRRTLTAPREKAEPAPGQPHPPSHDASPTAAASPTARATAPPPREKAEPAPGQPHPPSHDAPTDDVPETKLGWPEVARLATRQSGWVHRSQLRAAGFDRGAVRHAVQSGRLFRRRGELFLVGHEHLSPGADQAAALLVGGPGSVLSHRSAAAAWGLLVWSGRVEVTARSHRRSRRDVSIHQSALDTRRDVTHRHGVPVTSLLRTIVDCAAVMTEQGLARLINEAAIKGWLHARNVAALLAMIRGRRGARSLRQALVARDRSKGWTRSTLERAFADLAIEAKLPPSKRGSTIDIGGGDFRECDVVWREQRVMVELDYLPIHETGHTPYRDRRRDRRLAAAGWIVIRITGEDLSHHRAEVVDDLRRALDLNR